MNGYNSGTEPCWMPLMELIETCLFDIIHTEDTTGRFIRLYGAGDYWHAFEESAYQLSQLFVTHDVTVLRHKVYPFPVLMVSISDDELQAYGKNHIFRKKVSGVQGTCWDRNLDEAVQGMAQKRGDEILFSSMTLHK